MASKYRQVIQRLSNKKWGEVKILNAGKKCCARGDDDVQQIITVFHHVLFLSRCAMKNKK